MFNSFFVILVSSILLWCFYYYLKNFHRMVILSKKFNGPPALPIIGNALILMGFSNHDIVPIVLDLIQSFGERVRLWIGPHLFIITSNLKDVEEILSNSKFIEKAHMYKICRPWLSGGVALSSYEKWSKRRKIITTGFHVQILEQYVGVFDRLSSIFIENLSKCENTNKVDLLPFINLLALDVICETAMGVKINVQNNSDSDYVKAVHDLTTILYQRITNVFYQFDFVLNLMPIGRKQKKALQIIHDFSDKVITARREGILRNQQSENETTISTNKRRMAFLDILLQSKIDDKPLSNLDIREEVDTMMFAGHDTVVSALHFLFYLLARHPDAQRKCYEEVCTVLDLEDKNKSITYQNLHELKYLELCIKESLRLYPPGPLFGRKIMEECTINGNLYPAGADVVIFPYVLGRSEDLFSNANEFIPERFNFENGAEKFNPFAYLPFSAGPRNCIGQKFAMLEMKTIVSKFLHHYELEYVGDPEGPVLSFEIVFRSSNILWFKIKPRL